MHTRSDDTDIFAHGAIWLRADFHLHTEKDATFSYSGQDFCNDYIAGLKAAGIGVGVITNHNKFDWQEFKTLSRRARREQILLLPGVEFSVNDGANGIHMLLVFSEEWIEAPKQKDHISDFLTAAFQGQSSKGLKTRSNYDIRETLKALEAFGRDYFLICAHVEESSGLWEELKGGRISELGTDAPFVRRCLAFQQVRTRDRTEQVKTWLGDWYPAEVEGSDCKCIDDMCRDRFCYTKIGNHSFAAVKAALINPQRVADEAVRPKHSWIRSVSFDGGILDGKMIRFSPGLNALIGVRGSGKSAIIECIRYTLGIPFGHKAMDSDYKEGLSAYALGSGGRVTVEAVDHLGKVYNVRRILGSEPQVYDGDQLVEGISIEKIVLQRPLYFGQGDLSNTGDGFEADLVDKLLGDALAEVRDRIEAKCREIREMVHQLNRLHKVEEDIRDQKRKRSDAEFSLERYAEFGVEEKLKKQSSYDDDERYCVQLAELAAKYVEQLECFIEALTGRFGVQLQPHSLHNEEFMVEVHGIFTEIESQFAQIRELLLIAKTVVERLESKGDEFGAIRRKLADEFAETARNLAQELREQGGAAITAEEFRRLRTAVKDAEETLVSLQRDQEQIAQARAALAERLAELRNLWAEEHSIIVEGLEKINNSQPALKISAVFRGDKESFAIKLKDAFQGSGVRKASYDEIAQKYADGICVYQNLDDVRDIVKARADAFVEHFEQNLADMLTYQVPNRYVVTYREKELRHHSLGQRASALMLFILSQRDNDVIMIDQPEDDLDNQTIYEDVIKMVAKLKSHVQFIFATHNANIPVLGDAEQIHACSISDQQVGLDTGSIDSSALQQKVVDIMEGGQEAFDRRNEIYQLWRPSCSDWLDD